MRIISKFKDYYDSAMAFGQDVEFVYVRKKVELALDKSTEDRLYEIRQELPDISTRDVGSYYSRYIDITESYIIGFCGKIYPCLILKIPRKDDEDKSHIYYTYSYDKVIQILQQHKLKDILKDLEENTSFYNSKNRLKKFFNLSSSEFQPYFIDNKAPIFVIDFKNEANKINVTLNGELSNLKFYQKFGAYTAFQEIAMYLDGVIGANAPDMAEIDDFNMRGKKGFDNASFKHMPDTRQRKQKKGKLPKKRR